VAVYACAIEHTMQGQVVINAIGFARTDLLGAETVAEAEIVAEQVAIAWKARFMVSLNPALRFERVTARGMKDAEVSGLSFSAPVVGGDAGAALPSFVALRIALKTATPGRAGRGRTGVSGLAESATEALTPNTLTPGIVTIYQNALTSFRSDLAALTPTIFPVVISRVANGVPRVVPIASPVIGATVLSQIGSRVSRLR
jgi:hypothetical protein